MSSIFLDFFNIFLFRPAASQKGVLEREDLGHIIRSGERSRAYKPRASAEGYIVTYDSVRCYGEIAGPGDSGWPEGEKLGEKSGGVWADDCWYFMATAQGRRMG